MQTLLSVTKKTTLALSRWSFDILMSVGLIVTQALNLLEGTKSGVGMNSLLHVSEFSKACTRQTYQPQLTDTTF